MKDDKIYLAHILDAIRDVEEMTMGMDEQAFLKDKAVPWQSSKVLRLSERPAGTSRRNFGRRTLQCHGATSSRCATRQCIPTSA